jgi:hypothetical protein
MRSLPEREQSVKLLLWCFLYQLAFKEAIPTHPKIASGGEHRRRVERHRRGKPRRYELVSRLGIRGIPILPPQGQSTLPLLDVLYQQGLIQLRRFHLKLVKRH